MGLALAKGFVQNKSLRPQELWLYDKNPQQLSVAVEKTGALAVTDPVKAIELSDTVLIAVKPSFVSEVIGPLRSVLKNRTLISIAAGVSLSQLKNLVDEMTPVVRVMPNLAAQTGAGVSAVSFSKNALHLRAEIEQLFAACGQVFTVAEAQMDAVTGLAGSGPAFVLMMIEALADGGVLEGLSRPVALQMATQTVLGAAKLLQAEQRHPAALKDEVCSPGGTTIHAVAELEAKGFRSAVISAVTTAARHAGKLSQHHD